MQRYPSLVVTLLAILSCFLWSTAFAGIKIGLKYADPLSFAGIRFMLSGVMLMPFWWKRSSLRQLGRSQMQTILKVSFFQTFLLYGLFYLGIAMVSGALAAIVIGASPLITAIVAHFFMADDEMTLPKLISLGVGVFGVAIISVSRQPWASPAGLMEFSGILILIAACVAGALGNILVARQRLDLDPIFLNSVQIFIGGLALLLVSLPWEGTPEIYQPVEYYGALLWLAAISAVAVSLWFMLLQQPGAKVSELNLWKFIVPVSGAALSWALLPEESPQPVAVIGMVCIAASIVLFNRCATDSPGTQKPGLVREG